MTKFEDFKKIFMISKVYLDINLKELKFKIKLKLKFRKQMAIIIAMKIPT